MKTWVDAKLKLVSRNSKLNRIANEYVNLSMWCYIEDYKDEYKKPNHVGKMRHRAVRKECYKMAVKKLKEEE